MWELLFPYDGQALIKLLMKKKKTKIENKDDGRYFELHFILFFVCLKFQNKEKKEHRRILWKRDFPILHCLQANKL